MSPLIVLFALLAVAHIVFNVRVSRNVWTSDYYDTAQKRAQIGAIWLLPVLGVALAWMCLEKPQIRGATGDGEPDEGDVANEAPVADAIAATVGGAD